MFNFIKKIKRYLGFLIKVSVQKILANLYVKFEKNIFIGNGIQVLVFKGERDEEFKNHQLYLNGMIGGYNEFCKRSLLEKDIILNDFEKELPNKFNWKGRPGFKILQDVLHTQNKKKTTCSILDIGCYVGYLPAMLKNLNCLDNLEYFGYDISARFIKIAEYQKYVNCKFYAGNIDDLQGMDNIKNKKFDIVYSEGTLIMMPQPVSGLENIINFAEKYLVLNHTAIGEDVDFNRYNEKKYLTGMSISTDLENTYLISIFRKSFILETLKKHGFELDLIRPRKNGIKHLANFGKYELYDLVFKKNN